MQIYLIDSWWDIIGFILWSGLAIYGALNLCFDIRNKKKKK